MMFPDFTDLEIIAKTAWGEARSGGHDGMQAVINVISNRANKPSWWGTDMRSVCLKYMQFDCWLPQIGPNYTATVNVDESDSLYCIALDLASKAINGALEDITNGSTYYFSKTMKQWPVWAKDKNPAADIGNQLFFNNID